MGLNQPQQFTVNQDEDGDGVIINDTWSFTPTLVVAFEGKSGRFQIVRQHDEEYWDDGTLVVALAEVTKLLLRQLSVALPPEPDDVWDGVAGSEDDLIRRERNVQTPQED